MSTPNHLPKITENITQTHGIISKNITTDSSIVVLTSNFIKVIVGADFWITRLNT